MRVLLYSPCYTIDKDAQSLRITKLANALAARGWQFDVVTTPVFFLQDQALRDEVQQIHRVLPHLRVFLTSPATIATLRYRLHSSQRLGDPVVSAQRGNGEGDVRYTGFLRHILRQVNSGYNRIFARIGDPDWILPAVGQGIRLLHSRSYQVVFSSASSYFASHIAAATVSAIGGAPLVLDYGDPWSPEPPTRPKWLDRVSEASVLRRARSVTVTNDRAREALLSHYPFLRREGLVVISQGYEGRSRHDEASAHDVGQFTIVYTGNLYPGFQSPLEFLKAIRIAASHGMKVRFLRAGSDLSRAENELIRHMGLDSFTQELGRLPHPATLALQRKATMLLVIGYGNRSRLRIPGKVIEYIGANRPVLCLSQGPDDLAAQFVKEHGLGIVVPNQAESIAKKLTELNVLWQNGQLETIYHPRNVEPFSWRSLAHDLEAIFLSVSKSKLRCENLGQSAATHERDKVSQRQ